MSPRRFRALAPAGLLVASLLAVTLASADWPAYRYDSARNGASPEELPTPLHLQWTYIPAHAPRPAWPEPGRELHRMPFDYAFQVAIANGTVYFGSSADHKVFALDAATGRERWSFFTEGPVRFAPTVDGERVFVASDDGVLYCLAAEDGKLLWRFRGGRADERLMGNEQLISRWPLRTGVAVEEGTVYFSAGMWPGEGVYLYALRAADGTVIWRNDTSGSMYLPQPHPPSQAMTGVTPQGYIVVHEDQIFIPTGRNAPAAFDRDTGKLLYYRSRPDTWGDRWGGSYVFAAGGLLWNQRARPGPDIDVRLGESDPWEGDGLVVFDRPTGDVKLNLIGKHRAVTSGDVLYASGTGSVSAFDLKALLDGKKPPECKKWDAPHERAYELVLAGSTLVAGGRGTVTAIGAQKGDVLWKSDVEGSVYGLAAADGRLLVSTSTGQIACFAAAEVPDPPKIEATPQAVNAGDAAAEMASRIIADTGVTAGHCVVLGEDADLLAELAKQSALTIHAVGPGPDAVPEMRRTLDRAGLYGPRVAVHEAPPGNLPHPDYLADLVVLNGERAAEYPAAELYRVLRPLGGTLYVSCSSSDDGTSAAQVRGWLRKGGVPAGEIAKADRVVKVIRGKLAGAGEWTHQYADAGKSGCSNDQRAKLPLKLLWFGEPGPARLVSRHWKGPAPLSVDGRSFVIGQHTVTAVDAYNGRELWVKDLQNAGRFPVHSKGPNAAADGDSVYVATGASCVQLDAQTGETKQTYSLPPIPNQPAEESDKGASWDYLAVGDGTVFGTIAAAGESRHLFALANDTGQARWLYPAREAIHHDSVAIGDGAVYVIDKTSAATLDKIKRRGDRPVTEATLVALDAATGAVLWTTDRGLGGRQDLRWASGVLLATGGGRMTAYSAATGKMLSWSGVTMRGFPLITGDTIYGEPRAYDLRTGEPKLREHPLTGELVPWMFARSYGCGAVSGSPTMLLFRSGLVGFCDLAEDSGTHNFGGVRAGCYVNAIVANGLVLMPPADAACTCSYSYQTTVALAPAAKNEEWAVFSAQQVGEGQTIRHLALNLGAVGDRRDSEGQLWLSSPRPPTGQALKVPVTIEVAPEAGYYRRNADDVVVAGTDNPWLYASGCEGLQTATFALGPAEAKSYTVRLHFAEIEDLQPGQRVFDVKLQGKPALESVDIVREVAGTGKALLKEVKGIQTNGELKMELVPRTGRAPVLSAIEIHEE